MIQPYQLNKTLYIFRHGLATHSTHGYGRAIMSAKVLPEGVAPIERMSEFLKKVPNSFNVSSEYNRCRETVAIVSRITGKEFVFDPLLNEFHRATFTSLKERIMQMLQKLSAVPQGNILICSHGAVIAALTSYITMGKHTEKLKYNFPKTGELLILKQNKPERIDFNS